MSPPDQHDPEGAVGTDLAWKILMFLALIMIPAALTMWTIKDPGTLAFDPPNNPNRSPYGYTVSLLLFIIPDIALLRWLYKHPGAGTEFKALTETILLVFVTGCLLDFFLCYQWFYYPNAAATLGINLPAFDITTFRWIPNELPIEEFGFYSFGAVFMMSLYAYGDVSWFSRYRHPDPKRHSETIEKIIQPDWRWLWVGLALWGLGWVIKLLLNGGGLPGYWFFLVLIGVFPPAMMLKTIGPLINWRSFSFMYLALLAVSIVWEATLGVHQGWWNYKHDQMIGIFIGPWGDLPFEAVMMWLISCWAVALMYEVLKLIHYSGKGRKEMLLGRK